VIQSVLSKSASTAAQFLVVVLLTNRGFAGKNLMRYLWKTRLASAVKSAIFYFQYRALAVGVASVKLNWQARLVESVLHFRQIKL